MHLYVPRPVLGARYTMLENTSSPQNQGVKFNAGDYREKVGLKSNGGWAIRGLASMAGELFKDTGILALRTES